MMDIKELYGGDSRRNPSQMYVQMLRQGQTLTKSERTRWHRNRQMYLGNQWLRVVGTSVRNLVPTDSRPGQRRREVSNRLRAFVDGRVSMLTYKRPVGRVLADSHDIDMLEKARTAEEFLTVKAHSSEWDLQSKWRALALAGDIDGIAWLNVLFDPDLGKSVDLMIDRMSGQPIQKREMVEALRAEDPNGEFLWAPKKVPVGDVVFRVVRAGAISIDPLAQHCFDEARYVIESRVMSVADVERQAGKKIQELVDASRDAYGTDAGRGGRDVDDGAVGYEDEDGNIGYSPRSQSVIVHEAFIRQTPPGGEWPRGAHIKWVDHAPAAPYIVEPWEDDLPYIPYTPRPHGSSLVKSRGIVDDLGPLQVMFNRRLTQLGEWLDRVARPPLILQGGGLHPDTPRVFNEEGFVITKAGMGDPRFMTVPTEPTAIITQHLQFILDQMAEIALQNDSARGTPPGQGVEAAVGINLLIQQNEQQFAGTASQLTKVMEWGISRGLKLVAENYTIPRLVVAPGISSAPGFDTFVGSKITGATNYRINGSLLPRSQAAQKQEFMQFYQLSAGRFDATPYLVNYLEGDMDEITSRERLQEQRQQYEINLICALAQNPQIDQLWQDFNDLRQKYVQATMQMRGQVADPVQFLQSQGLSEPMLKDVGIQIPQVEDFDRDEVHLRTLEMFCSGDAYFKLHPLVSYALFEHRKAHKAKIGQNMMAMQQAQAPGASPGGGVNEQSANGAQQDQQQPSAPAAGAA